jgi:hypothetical protein
VRHSVSHSDYGVSLQVDLCPFFLCRSWHLVLSTTSHNSYCVQAQQNSQFVERGPCFSLPGANANGFFVCPSIAGAAVLVRIRLCNLALEMSWHESVRFSKIVTFSDLNVVIRVFPPKFSKVK